MKKILTFFFLLVLVLAAIVFFLPGMMERGAALWLRHHASQSGVTITFDRIRAPFLQPMVIENMKMTRPAKEGAAHLELNAPLVELEFHLASAFGMAKREHTVRSLRARHLTVFVRGRAAAPGAFDWNALAWLLPEEFDLQADRVSFDQPLLHTQWQDVALNGGEGRSGNFTVGTIDFRAPLFHQTFTNVHGVTRWQDDRLVVAGIRLREGLSFDSITLDLTKLVSERLAAEFAASIFGGTLRANVATEKGTGARLWEGAASLNGISFAQLSSALGATEEIAGTVRASKFTFHGDPRDIMHATGSVWMELTGFKWRERNADVVMLGANFYNRVVQLQELFLKQRANEFTLSGETTLGADWLNSDFRGELSGAINDLGQFAELFGRSSSDFRGKISVRGRVHSYERKIDGEVALTGDDLVLFRVPVALLTARGVIDSARFQLAQFDLKRGRDFLNATGELRLDEARGYSLAAKAECAEAADYNFSLPLFGKLAGHLVGTLSSSGTFAEQNYESYVTNESLEVATKARYRGNVVTFDELRFKNSSGSAALTGELNLGDRHHVTGSFTAPEEMRFEVGDGKCVRGFRLAASDTAQPFRTIQFDGREVRFDGDKRAQLCPTAEAGEPLTFAPSLPPPEQPSNVPAAR